MNYFLFTMVGVLCVFSLMIYGQYIQGIGASERGNHSIDFQFLRDEQAAVNIVASHNQMTTCSWWNVENVSELVFQKSVLSQDTILQRQPFDTFELIEFQRPRTETLKTVFMKQFQGRASRTDRSKVS